MCSVLKSYRPEQVCPPNQENLSQMATAQSTSASSAKPRRAAAPKSARAKTPARASTSRASASNASSKRSTTAVKNPTVGSYAERAVLIPVGAALIAREQVLAQAGASVLTQANQQPQLALSLIKGG